MNGTATAIPAPSGAPPEILASPTTPTGPETGPFRQTIAFHHDPRGFLRENQQRYGDVFSIRLLTARPVVVSGDLGAVAR